MLEDTSTAVPSPVSIQGKSSFETDKDPLRYTPSKRMFLGIDFPSESHKKTDVKCLKSNSKILKKKRHKDKLKLSKLDKLLDPSVQLPQLGKSAKYFKKKKKLQVSGSQISGNEITRSAEKKYPILCFPQLMPLEYTFDILSVTDNASLPRLVKDPEVKTSSENDLSTNISFLDQEVVPIPKVDVTSSSFRGDLINLETPKPFKSKVGQYDDHLSEIPIGKIVKLDEVNNDRPQPPNLNSLLIDLAGLNSLYVEDELMNSKGEVKSSESGEQPARADLQEHNDVFPDEKSDFEVDHHHPNHSELSGDVPDKLWQIGKRFSPEAYDHFPGNNSPISVEKPILLSQHPLQMLVDQLKNDPYPKAVRENARIWVRRRAFSLNNAQIESLFWKPSEDPKSQSEVSKAEDIANGEVSIQKSKSPTETIKHRCSVSKDDTGTADQSENCTPSTEMTANDLPDSTRSPAASNVDIDDDKSSTNRTLSSEDQSISEGGSDLTLVIQVTDMNISKEDSIELVSGNSVRVPEECENLSVDVKADVMGMELNLSSGTNTTPTEHLTANSSRTTLTCTKQVSESPEEKSSKPSTSSAENLTNVASNTIPHEQVSSDLDTALNSSQNVLQETADGETVGVLVNSELDDHNEIPFQVISQETPVLPPLVEKELSESLAPSVTSVTNLSKSDVDGNDGTCRQNKTSITLGTGLSSLKLFCCADIEKSNLDPLKPFSDDNLVDISSRPVSQSTGESDFGDLETITDLMEDKATPTGVNSRYEDSDDDSNLGDECCITPLEHWVLPPGKKFRRSLSIIRNLEQRPSPRRGRHYEISVEEIIKLQGNNAEARTPVQILRTRLSMRRSLWMSQITPPPVRRNTFLWSPKPADRGTLYETPPPRKSIYSTPLQKNLALRMSLIVSPVGPRKSLRPTNQNSPPPSPVQYTIRDLILTICKQTEPLSFYDILNEDSYEGGCKLGEGVFGEVFSINRDGQNAVLKIIPIEGLQLVNGEKQKTYQEVLSELVIAKVLNELRYEGSDEFNLTSGYAELIATSLVQGSYPKTLLGFWEEFDQTKGSDNDNPNIFDEQQLFIVMEQGNGGKDLESYIFSSAKQSLSIFKQIAFSLAVAEQSVEFEHRDLHWGNVLVTKTSEKHISYTLNGTKYSVASNGVKCTIIDYTLSRIKYINQFPIYNDIGKDPEMFIATGDYQFDIYRFMKEDVGDDWSRFVPKTNARWLHYLLDKMLTKVKYQRKTAKVHKDSVKMLEEIGSWIEDCDGAVSVALHLAESKN